MLPARHRMRRSDDFTDAVRRGTRSGARRLVVHLRSVRIDQGPTGARGEDAALVGFVVPKSVGSAVRRNEVKRRLRALMAERLDALVPGARVVVRALPPAARSTSAELAQDLDRALAGARRREHRRAEPGRVA